MQHSLYFLSLNMTNEYAHNDFALKLQHYRSGSQTVGLDPFLGVEPLFHRSHLRGVLHYRDIYITIYNSSRTIVIK